MSWHWDGRHDDQRAQRRRMSRAGLDRSTLVVAGVATVGLIMAALDTTIVNVALALDWAAVMALLLAERARRRVERPSRANPDHGRPKVPRSSAA